MPDEMTYSGHELLNTSFALSHPPREKIYYRFRIQPADEFTFQERFNSHNEHTHNEISILFDASARGFNQHEGTPAYTLNINYLIRFIVNKNCFIGKQSIKRHSPLFMNVASQSARTLIDSVLAYNAIPGIFMPSERER